MISLCRERRNLVLAVILFTAVLSLVGCTSIKYSYNAGTGFPGLRSYGWAPSSVIYGEPDSLLEVNVKVFADQFLGQKGFTKVAEKPDLLILINYERESGYELRMLTLNIYKSETKELIWRGTASASIGNISTDAASGDLRRAVQGILSKLPVK